MLRTSQRAASCQLFCLMAWLTVNHSLQLCADALPAYLVHQGLANLHVQAVVQAHAYLSGE
jgi:hypothetical protein